MLRLPWRILSTFSLLLCAASLLLASLRWTQTFGQLLGSVQGIFVEIDARGRDPFITLMRSWPERTPWQRTAITGAEPLFQADPSSLRIWKMTWLGLDAQSGAARVLRDSDGHILWHLDTVPTGDSPAYVLPFLRLRIRCWRLAAWSGIAPLLALLIWIRRPHRQAAPPACTPSN